jgi:hypothetical protein
MEQPPAGESQQWSPERPWDQRVRQEGYRRLDRLSPILHDLLAWDLVFRTESGSFVLRDDVQRWLAEALVRQSRSAPEVYVGRPCQRCGSCGVTRMVGEVRLCDPCSQMPAIQPTDELETKTHKRRGHHDVRWWGRKAG